MGLGWELVVSGKASGRVSSNTGCGQFQFLQPRAGLSLGVFWAASSLWRSDQLWMGAAAMQRRLLVSGDIYAFTTVANVVRVPYAQKYVHSLINCIFRYSLICWAHGTDELPNMLRCQRGITWELCCLIVVPVVRRQFLCRGSIL